MKSRLVKVKVWYEHDDDVLSADIPAALERLVLQSLTLKEDGGVRVHSYEVGDTLLSPRRPEPDF